jgi:hypothetical protein
MGEEKVELEKMRAYLKWHRVDHTRIKLVPEDENPIDSFKFSGL